MVGKIKSQFKEHFCFISDSKMLQYFYHLSEKLLETRQIQHIGTEGFTDP